MAHVFKHKKTKKLYVIEHLITDLRFLNGGAFTGIYAYSYRWEGKTISHTKQKYLDNEIQYFDPKRFVDENFEIVNELW